MLTTAFKACCDLASLLLSLVLGTHAHSALAPWLPREAHPYHRDSTPRWPFCLQRSFPRTVTWSTPSPPSCLNANLTFTVRGSWPLTLIYPIPLPSTTSSFHTTDYFVTCYMFYLFIYYFVVCLPLINRKLNEGRDLCLFPWYTPNTDNSIWNIQWSPVEWMDGSLYQHLLWLHVYLSVLLTTLGSSKGHWLCCSWLCFQSLEPHGLCIRPSVTGIKKEFLCFCFLLRRIHVQCFFVLSTVPYSELAPSDGLWNRQIPSPVTERRRALKFQGIKGASSAWGVAANRARACAQIQDVYLSILSCCRTPPKILIYWKFFFEKGIFLA